MDDDEITQQKNIAYYECLVNSYLENSLELDRQILNLSCLGIGFLSTIINESSLFSIWLIINVCFLISIIFILFTFSINKKIAIDAITEKNSNESEKLGRVLSMIAYIFFGIAILLLIIYTPLNIFIKK